jgi:hypothetical protein
MKIELKHYYPSAGVRSAQAQASIILCWKIVLSIYDILQIAIKPKCMIQRSLLSSYLILRTQVSIIAA